MFVKYKYTIILVEQAKFEIKILQGEDNYVQTGITSQNINKVDIVDSDNVKGVDIILDDKGKEQLEEITLKNKGKHVGMFFDDVIISLPIIQDTIRNGHLLLLGNFTYNELLALKVRLLGYYYPNFKDYKNYQTKNSSQKIKNETVTEDNTEVQASHILICYNGSIGCDSKLTKEDAQKKIEELKLLATPENFAELAATNSTEPGADVTKGELGWFKIGEIMVKPFEDAVFNAEVGQIIGPIETKFGFHLIYKINEIKEDVTTPGWKTYNNKQLGVEFIYPDRFEYSLNDNIEFRNINFPMEKRSEPTPELSFNVINNESGEINDLCEYVGLSVNENCEDLEINNKKFVHLVTGEMYVADSYYHQNNNMIIFFNFYQKGKNLGFDKEEIEEVIGSIKFIN